MTKDTVKDTRAKSDDTGHRDKYVRENKQWHRTHGKRRQRKGIYKGHRNKRQRKRSMTQGTRTKTSEKTSNDTGHMDNDIRTQIQPEKSSNDSEKSSNETQSEKSSNDTIREIK